MKKPILAAALAACMQQACAVDIKAGDWTVSVGGIVNAYYTGVSCGGDDVGGLALGGKALGCGGEDRRTTVGNGLLPNALLTSVSSRQGGIDVAATIGIYAATATDSAISQNSQVDVRQAYFTFGNATLGTFKLGRDYGIFSHDAILGDMTLVGAGAPVQATQRGRVTLGHIGAGYAYPGNYGQIVYATPQNASGIRVDVGVMSPVADTPVVAGSRYATRSSPQFQARVRLEQGGFKAWLGAKRQRFESRTAGADDLDMHGVEAGASWQGTTVGLLANAQAGKALGILSDADQGDTKTKHFLVQGTIKATDALKLGLSWGRSANDADGAGAAGLKSNANLTAGAYYTLTGAITLVAEVGQTRSKGFAGNTARLNGGSAGGILFF
ncbi:porin [uncultured Massilia sp.]|uniref:porin n=1 Tax=uncultured Massilia sp. TaxID=169973 RepID=UPI0025E9479D|nr:porin [uncultured Massilia sp.]